MIAAGAGAQQAWRALNMCGRPAVLLSDARTDRGQYIENAFPPSDNNNESTRRVIMAAAAATLVLFIAQQLRDSMPLPDAAALAAAAAATASTTPLHDVLSVPARLTRDHGPHVLLAVEAIARALLGATPAAAAAAATVVNQAAPPHMETPLHVAIEATVAYTMKAYHDMSATKPHKAMLHSFHRDWLRHAPLSELLPRLITALLDAGADRTARNRRGMAPAHFMTLACNGVTLVSSRHFLGLLLDVQLVDVAGQGGRTLLHDACAVADIGAVKMLLSEYGANVHAVDSAKRTPLDRVRLDDVGRYSCTAKIVLEALLLQGASAS